MKTLIGVISIILGIAIIAAGCLYALNYINGAAVIAGDSEETMVVNVETGRELLIGQSLVLAMTGTESENLPRYFVTCTKTDGDGASHTRTWDSERLVLNLDADSCYEITIEPAAGGGEGGWKIAASKNIRKCSASLIKEEGLRFFR